MDVPLYWKQKFVSELIEFYVEMIFCYEHNSVKHNIKYTSKNSLEQVLELLNGYIVQIYISGVITSRKKLQQWGYSQKNTIPSKERRLIQGIFRIMDWFMDNKKKRQENNFQSVHKKNKAY